MFNLETLIRPHLRTFKPYSSARDEFQGSASIYLDANENPFPAALNRYPDSKQHALRRAGANWLGVKDDNLLFVNGSDEGIDLLIRAFVSPGEDKIVISSPTYGMYKVWADVSNIEIIDVPLISGFKLDTDKLINRNNPNEKLLFICSPNNPSGNTFPINEIEKILKAFTGIVVIDEAYIDFSSTPSLIKNLRQYPNLVILRTLSKAWGLAGLRMGIVVSSKEIISVLDRIRPPYNISTLGQEIVRQAIEEQLDSVIDAVRVIKDERSKVRVELFKISSVLEVYPSEANFLLVKTTHPNEIYAHLVSAGIVVRDRSTTYGCEGCLRVTIGTPEENIELIKAWRAAV